MARKAMLGDVAPAQHVPPIVVAPPDTVSTTVSTAAPVKKLKAPAWLNATNAKKVVRSFWFRYAIVFVATIVLLMIIKPPFVQLRRKNQSALEKAPTSYKRVMITAVVATGLVAILPSAYTHRSKFMSTVSLVKKWF